LSAGIFSRRINKSNLRQKDQADMTRDPFQRRKTAKLTIGVLAVGTVISALLAFVLLFMGRMHPHF
jgi:hypothetical protein